MVKKGNKRLCNKCNNEIGVSQFDRHNKVCNGPRIKKIRGIDYDPNWGFEAGIRTAWNKGKPTGRQPKTPDKEAFVENSKVSRGNIKNRIIYDNMLDYKCSECNVTNIWNGKELNLHLDHINGIHNDHRLENLRFLCPNCHSQTHTYAGRNKAYKNSPIGRADQAVDSKSTKTGSTPVLGTIT